MVGVRLGALWLLWVLPWVFGCGRRAWGRGCRLVALRGTEGG